MAAADNGRGVWLCHYHYGAGAEGARSKLGSVFLPLLIAVVIRLDLRYIPLTRGSDPSQPTAAG